MPKHGHASVIPTPDPHFIKDQLSRFSRDPFREDLTKFIGCSPNKKSIKHFANKQPDRYVQSVTMLARLSGYHERVQHEHSHLHVHAMSDSELLATVQGLEKETGEFSSMSDQKVIEATAKLEAPKPKRKRLLIHKKNITLRTKKKRAVRSKR